MTMIFVGIYMIIFGLSIHVLHRKNSDAYLTSKLYMNCTIALFTLATIFVAIYAWGTSRQAIIEFNAATTKNYTSLVMYLTKDSKKTACL